MAIFYKTDDLCSLAPVASDFIKRWDVVINHDNTSLDLVDTDNPDPEYIPLLKINASVVKTLETMSDDEFLNFLKNIG